MDISSFSLIGVFVAGMLVFLAPCTLPLLPAYLGFLSGLTQQSVATGVSQKEKRRVVLHAVLFVSGFILVFALLGLLAGVAGTILAPLRGWLKVIGGVFVILFGFMMLGVFAGSFLDTTKRILLPRILTVGTPLSSFLLGMAFGVGWTPCNGPMLGAVLSYVGTSQAPLTSMMLLGVYGLGFSVPFLTLAILFSHASRIVDGLAPYLRIVSIVGGAVLIVLGLWLVFGHTYLTNWFFDLFRYLDVEDVLIRFL